MYRIATQVPNSNEYVAVTNRAYFYEENARRMAHEYNAANEGAAAVVQERNDTGWVNVAL